MQQRNVLQVGGLTDRFNQRLAAEHKVTALWQQADPQAFLAQHGAEFELVATSARFGCSAELLAQLPNVRAICSFGVGTDSLAVDVARDRGIAVSNTPDVLNDCVADLAMGLIIDAARGMSSADRFVRDGGWLKGNFPLARSVTGKRLGIVGLGRIGQAVAKRASGFDMPVRYHNRRAVADSPLTYEADLLALAEWADFLLLTCPGGSSTHHLISTAALAALGTKGILINVARGSVVDQQALVKALQNGVIGGAGLDVFADEPNVPSELLALENVVLLPHIGSGTAETRLRMEELVHANIAAFVSEGRLVTAL